MSYLQGIKTEQAFTLDKRNDRNFSGSIAGLIALMRSFQKTQAIATQRSIEEAARIVASFEKRPPPSVSSIRVDMAIDQEYELLQVLKYDLNYNYDTYAAVPSPLRDYPYLLPNALVATSKKRGRIPKYLLLEY